MVLSNLFKNLDAAIILINSRGQRVAWYKTQECNLVLMGNILPKLKILHTICLVSLVSRVSMEHEHVFNVVLLGLCWNNVNTTLDFSELATRPGLVKAVECCITKALLGLH